jgi:7,8-dihydro-6-hydroxymethylpterin-pyrophosphokinase
MAERAFVLLPLHDLAPALQLPGHGAVRNCWHGSILPVVKDCLEP